MRSSNYNANPDQPDINRVPLNSNSVLSGSASATTIINHQNGNVSNWNHFNVHPVQPDVALSTSTTYMDSVMIHNQSPFDQFQTGNPSSNLPYVQGTSFNGVSMYSAQNQSPFDQFQTGNPSSNLPYVQGTSFNGVSMYSAQNQSPFDQFQTGNPSSNLPYVLGTSFNGVSMYGAQNANMDQAQGGPWPPPPQYYARHEAPRLSNNFSHYGTQNGNVVQAEGGPWLPPDQNSLGNEARRLNDDFTLLGLFRNQNTTIAQDQGGSWILPEYSVPPESARLSNNASRYCTQNASVAPQFLNVPRHLHIVLPRIQNAPHLRIFPEDEVGILEMSHSDGDTNLGDENIHWSHINHFIEDVLILEDEGIDERRSGISEEAALNSLETRTLVSHAKDAETKICIICQDGYEVQEKIGTLYCGHEYHKSCIKQWFLVNNRCPVCRRQALDDDKSSLE